MRLDVEAYESSVLDAAHKASNGTKQSYIMELVGKSLMSLWFY